MQILTFYERQRIEYYRRLHLGLRDIGRRMKRNHSDIVRELRRNTVPGERYSALKAQAKANRRATKTNKRKLETDESLHDFVASELKKGWSPELIAGRLQGDDAPPHMHGSTVSHEQIYEYIYDGPGRYEGWYHLLIRLHRVINKTADENERAIVKTLEPFPEEYQRSMSFDRGSESTCHTKIRDAFRMDTFFCAAYAAWQKGGVENAIGLLRRHLPKKTDLGMLTDDQLHAIQEKLNDRPRKKLNYKTPNEVLRTSLGGALNS